MSLFSRVFLACAAVVLSIMGPQAAEAYPTPGEQPFLRSNKHSGLPFSGPPRPTGTNSESAHSWRDPDRDVPPVNHFSLRKGHSGYKTNSPGNQPYSEQMGQLHRGQHLSGAKSATARSSHLNPQLPRMNHNSFLHSNLQNGESPGFVAPQYDRSHLRHLPIMRKSSHQGWPLPQRSALQAQKANQNEHIFGRGTSMETESRNKDWQSLGNFPGSFQRSGYWRSQTHRKGDNIEIQAGTSVIHASKFPTISNRNSFIPTLDRSKEDASVDKPEKLTSPIAQSFEGKKTSYKRVQSSFLRHSHPPEAPKGINAPNSQYNAHHGQDFDQQARLNLKSANKGDQSASAIYRTPKINTLSPFEDADTSRQMNKNAHLKESFNLNKEFSRSFSNQKKAALESSNFRLIRPTVLQKYSFQQRIVPMPSSREKIVEHSSPEPLVTASVKSSVQEYGSQNTSDEVEKSVQESEPRTTPENSSTAISSTSAQPQPIIQEDSKQNDHGAKGLKGKAIIYDDIIGSASFSSFRPAETVVNVLEKSLNLTKANRTKWKSVGGERLDFSKGEADSELRISDWRVREEEREAKSVPHGLPSESEERLELDRLLELDYLRTSTGNVSFQSLNLNLNT